VRKDVKPEVFQQKDMFARAPIKITLHRNCVDCRRSLCETMSVNNRHLIKGTHIFTIFS
jgi:hypothetical protein